MKVSLGKQELSRFQKDDYIKSGQLSPPETYPVINIVLTERDAMALKVHLPTYNTLRKQLGDLLEKITLQRLR